MHDGLNAQKPWHFFIPVQQRSLCGSIHMHTSLLLKWVVLWLEGLWDKQESYLLDILWTFFDLSLNFPVAHGNENHITNINLLSCFSGWFIYLFIFYPVLFNNLASWISCTRPGVSNSLYCMTHFQLSVMSNWPDTQVKQQNENVYTYKVSSKMSVLWTTWNFLRKIKAFI